jgi:hypothetical protein
LPFVFKRKDLLDCLFLEGKATWTFVSGGFPWILLYALLFCYPPFRIDIVDIRSGNGQF